MTGKDGFVGALVAAAIATGAAFAQPPVKTAIVRRSAFVFDCSGGGGFCRDKTAFNAYDARDRLGQDDFTLWVDGQNLNVAARSQADEVQIEGSFQEGLSPLSIGLPYFGATYRLPDIDKAVIELRVKGQGAERPSLVFRGPQAPPAPPANARLIGRLQVVQMQSRALQAARNVSIYLPPGRPPKGGWPTIIAADGDAIEPFVAILDALIERRDIRPVALMATWPGLDAADRAQGGLRAREYLRKADAVSWDRHTAFVLREALPMAQKRFGVTAGARERMLFGYGEGADWVLEAAARHSDLAQTVAAVSPSDASEPPFRGGAGKDMRLYISAGLYEGPYLKGARTLCNLATASFVPCTLDITATGHAPLAWQDAFAKAVRRTFPAKAR